MLRSIFRSLVTLLVLSALVWALMDESARVRRMGSETLAAMRQDARTLAQHGRIEEAVDKLRALRRHAPDHAGVQKDLLALLSRMDAHPSSSPDPEQARDGARFLALPGTSSLSPSRPGDRAARPGSASSVRDNSRDRGPRGRTARAASTSDTGHASESGDEATSSIRTRALKLNKQGQAVQAWALARQHPDAFSRAELARLQGDYAAHWIRRAGRDPSLRERADQALEAFCRRAREKGPASARRRCRHDRMVWLARSERPEQAARLYRQLTANRDTVPAYVHREAVHLFLRRNRPARAEQALRRLDAVSDQPHPALWGELRLAQGQYPQARENFERAASRLPRANKAQRLSLKQKAVTVEAWRGHLYHALKRVNALLERHPGHTGLRLQREQLYRWQGWPRRAQRERQRLAEEQPNHGALLRARISAAITERRFADAGELLQRYRKRYPHDPGGRALRERFDTATGTRFTGEWHASRTRGEGITQPVRSWFHQQRLYSPAWSSLDDTRAFVFRQHRHARFRGGRGSIRRRGAGIRSEHRDWGLTLGWRRQARASEASGPTVSAHVEFSDFWGLDLQYQQDSDRTPIRAATRDIEAVSSTLALRHHRSDGHDYRLAATRTRFTDDNRRLEFALSGSQPLYRNAPHRLLLRQSVGYMRNKRTRRPYFSPENAGAAQVQLDYTGSLPGTNGDWKHNAVAGAGLSSQAGFDNSRIGDFTYEHRYRFNRHLRVAVGAQWLRRMYDGNIETTRGGFARLSWRLQ